MGPQEQNEKHNGRMAGGSNGNGGELDRAEDISRWLGLVVAILSALRSLDAFSAQAAIPLSHLAEKFRVGEDVIYDAVSSLHLGRVAVLAHDGASGRAVWVGSKATIRAFSRLHSDQADELMRLAESLQD